MPWGIGDVESFNKGLSTEAKKKWVAVANNTLAACRKRNGKDCDAIAVRTANAAVKEGDHLNIKNIFRKSVKIGGEYFKADISEATFDSAEGKKEMVITLLKEGPGNRFHNNYYKAEALESLRKLIESRPKQYYNHARNIDNPERDLRDWASSIKETWIVNEAGKSVLKGKTSVYDSWLWERAKVAPEELAVSLEGKGRGHSELIEGEKYNAIYEILLTNGVNWVDYPGNAGMGVEILEEEKQLQEESEMDMKLILEGMKNLSAEERKQLASAPELKEFLVLPAEKSSTELAELKESINQMKQESAKQIKDLTESLTAIKAENATLANKAEALELKEKGSSKGKLADRLLSESKLQDIHKTETFKNILLSVKEYSKDDKVVSEEDQMKQLIADREGVCIAEVAKAENNGGSGTELSEEAKARLFCKNVLGVEIKEEAKAEGKK